MVLDTKVHRVLKYRRILANIRNAYGKVKLVVNPVYVPGIVDEREIEHAYSVIVKYIKHTVMGNSCMRERKIEEKRGTVYPF